jgi:hypothetical protein
VDQESTPVGDVAQAKAFQQDLLRFLHGHDIGWPIYGEDRQITNITEGAFPRVVVPGDLRRRCEMINAVVLDPQNGV